MGAYFLTQSLLPAAIAGGLTLLLAGGAIGILLWIMRPHQTLKKPPYTPPFVQAPVKTVATPIYEPSRGGDLPRIEYYQRQLLRDPTNEKMISDFANELSKVYDGGTPVRIYIKFFDQAMLEKIQKQLPTNANFQLWQLINFYRNGTADLAVVRARLCLKEIKRQLSNGDVIGTAIDNGDCYFDTFAQGLNRFLTEPVTVKQLRMDVHEFCQDPKNEDWLKYNLKCDLAYGTYENYKKRIQYTAEECAKNEYPVWANSQVVGAILFEKYKVNIVLHEALENGAESIKALKVYESEPVTYPKGAQYNRNIKIASYGDHFFPIFSS